MSVMIPGPFTSYELTAQEEILGGILTTNQKQVIHNQRSQISQQILALVYDPAESMKFVQQDSFLKGQLSIYNYMLDRSSEAEKQQLEAAKNNGPIV